MNPNTRFLHALRREPVDATPIWLMRQAGRYMPEYRALRAQHSMLECIKTPDLATEITFQPLHAFDVDAAIVFADILTLPEAMGMELEFVSGTGPVFHNPIRHVNDLDRLRPLDVSSDLHFTLQTIQQVVDGLGGRLPLIGFSGAPFTLACYMIEGSGSRHFIHAKTFMTNQSQTWHRFMSCLAAAVADYLVAQIDAGAQAVQLFDSWAGILSPSDYSDYVAPHTRAVIAQVKAVHADVPIIHFGTETSTLLSTIADCGPDGVGVDWRIPINDAWRVIGYDRAIQGNLDPVTLFAPVPVIEQQAQRILDAVGKRPGHIFNLGHGVLPETPPDHVAALIDFVHRYTAQST